MSQLHEDEGDQVLECSLAKMALGDVNKNTESHESITSDGTTPAEAMTPAERVALLRELLETYLSDNYLTKDIFLLKHFRNSKEGWLSLKFMASYKRIKRTTKSLAEVEEAVRGSQLLELHPEGGKLRRVAPLPSCIDEYIPTRMAYIGALPEHLRVLSAISQWLVPFGEVESLHVIRPGTPVPEILKDIAASFPQLSSTWGVLVEFEEMSSASRCVAMVRSEGVWAKELVMPWKPRKDSTRSRCLSTGSSGYSSPMATPDQSPMVAKTHFKGTTKRERLYLTQGCPDCRSGLSRGMGSPAAKGQSRCRCPRRQTPASACDNWRVAPAAQ